MTSVSSTRMSQIEDGGAVALGPDELVWRQWIANRFQGHRSDEGEPDGLNRGLSRLLAINELLEDEYGTPDLGNKEDPVDELVYIILSRRTREAAYQSAFGALKRSFSSWGDLASAPLDAVEMVIRPVRSRAKEGPEHQASTVHARGSFRDLHARTNDHLDR